MIYAVACRSTFEILAPETLREMSFKGHTTLKNQVASDTTSYDTPL